MKRTIALSIALAAAISTANTPHASAKPLPYTGVNLSGGEFYDPSKVSDPVYGKNFTYPTKEEFTYFTGRGMNIFRVGFLWETLQPKAKGPFRQAEVDRLKSVVDEGTSTGAYVILDPHNYARYYGKVIGGPEVGYDDFADFWRRLSIEFKGNSHVYFGLVNEPHDLPTGQWLRAANAAIAAIRKAGARNLILVPGNNWTAAGSWVDTNSDSANADIMDQVKDPLNHYAYEVHLYFDPDNSGSHPDVASPTIGVDRVKAFEQWCRDYHRKAFLGEFGVAGTEEGRVAVGNLLHELETHPDVWIGYTWWSAGAWWPKDYMFSLEPIDGQDRPQMGWLKDHLRGLK